MTNSTQGPPTLFAVLISILDANGTGIVKDQASGLETYAMLYPVSPILLFVPLETRNEIVARIGCSEERTALVEPQGDADESAIDAVGKLNGSPKV